LLRWIYTFVSHTPPARCFLFFLSNFARWKEDLIRTLIQFQVQVHLYHSNLVQYFILFLTSSMPFFFIVIVKIKNSDQKFWSLFSIFLSLLLFLQLLSNLFSNKFQPIWWNIVFHVFYFLPVASSTFTVLVCSTVKYHIQDNQSFFSLRLASSILVQF
jgi:hypothetical protein